MEWFIPVGIFRKESNTLSAYHFARKFRWKILSNGAGIFWGAPKTGTRLSCTIYKIPVKFSLSLEMKPDTSSPNTWYRKFSSFR